MLFCLHCNKSLTGKQQKYCSKSCKNIHYEKQPHIIKRHSQYRQQPHVKKYRKKYEKTYHIKKAGIPNEFIEWALTQKHHRTDVEIIIEYWLLSNKILYEFQKHIDLPSTYTKVDFFIEPNICLYCDGDYYHSSEEAILKDTRINKELKSLDFKSFLLKIGGDPGGPLRFEFDGATRIKVRSRACRSCGFIDYWFNVEELKERHQEVFTKRLESLYQGIIKDAKEASERSHPYVHLTEGEFVIPLDAFPSFTENDWEQDKCPIRMDFMRELALEYINSRTFESRHFSRITATVTVRFDEDSQRFIGKWTSPKQEVRREPF